MLVLSWFQIWLTRPVSLGLGATSMDQRSVCIVLAMPQTCMPQTCAMSMPNWQACLCMLPSSQQPQHVSLPRAFSCAAQPQGHCRAADSSRTIAAGLHIPEMPVVQEFQAAFMAAKQAHAPWLRLHDEPCAVYQARQAASSSRYTKVSQPEPNVGTWVLTVSHLQLQTHVLRVKSQPDRGGQPLTVSLPLICRLLVHGGCLCKGPHPLTLAAVARLQKTCWWRWAPGLPGQWPT